MRRLIGAGVKGTIGLWIADCRFPIATCPIVLGVACGWRQTGDRLSAGWRLIETGYRSRYTFGFLDWMGSPE